MTPRCRDAVIVVPGILGSELIDPSSGEVIWGLEPKALAKTLISGSTFDRLRDDRLQAGDLLHRCAWLPGLTRFEPYTGLVRRLGDACVDTAAVAKHPYDWRRPLAQTAFELAGAAAEHLATWRSHRYGSSDARLVFVAHSMGGLLAWHAANLYLPPDDVLVVLTLGTPFGGSVRAIRAIGPGDLLPHKWHAAKLRACARELAALHDLLPQHPCVTADSGCIPPSRHDLISCGATPDLVDLSIETRSVLASRLSEPGHRQPQLIPLIGTDQQTLQSFTNDKGALKFHENIDGTNWAGDGTVYHGAAYPKGYDSAMPLPQQHGALASSGIALDFIQSTLQRVAVGPPQAGPGIGLATPDAVRAGDTFKVRVAAPKFAPVGCVCNEPGVRSLGNIPLTQRANDLGEPEWHGTLAISQPGLYTITATGGGFAAINNDVLVLPADD